MDLLQPLVQALERQVLRLLVLLQLLLEEIQGHHRLLHLREDLQERQMDQPQVQALELVLLELLMHLLEGLLIN